MSALAFSQLFLFFLFSTLLTRFWLAARQWRSVSKHRDKVPEQFVGNITPDAHRKAADYTLAKIRFSLTALVVDTIVLTGFTFGGGLQYLASHIFPITGNTMTLPSSFPVRSICLSIIIASSSSSKNSVSIT